MRLQELVGASGQVGQVSGRLDKIERLAALLRRLSPDEIAIAVAFLAGALRQGRIGLGPAAISAPRPPPAEAPTLELREVDEAFAGIGQASGAGSAAEKARRYQALLSRATAAEQDFLLRLVIGELRQGAQEGLLLEAVARAAAVPAERVRRAAMTAGELGPVAQAALLEGEAGLGRFLLRVFQPVQPMLADAAADMEEALAALGEAALEFKLDGARIQVHKAGAEVRVYSRQLREVTAAVPEVVQAARALPADELILDGEVIALRPDGAPHPFQVTMRRFGRKLEVERLQQELPLSPFFFDCLLLNGADLTAEPQGRRGAALRELAAPQLRVPTLVTASLAEAEAFQQHALARGHEGVMAKSLQAAYATGSRGSAWLKLKPAHTLDLVVLAAEWGSGRRTGFLSNLHLGARDLERGGFVMLGKTFKGLTDEMLAWQTQHLLGLELGRDGATVHVRPELVVEIAFNDVQQSPQYPGGLALRFARVKRHRTDKPAREADTLAAVQQIYRRATGLEPPPPR